MSKFCQRCGNRFHDSGANPLYEEEDGICSCCMHENEGGLNADEGSGDPDNQWEPYTNYTDDNGEPAHIWNNDIIDAYEALALMGDESDGEESDDDSDDDSENIE